MFDDRIVVHFKDGRILRGFGDNFFPGEHEVMVKDLDDRILTVPLGDVKVIAFVKRFDSDRLATHRPAPPLAYQAVPGKRVSVKFKDGETMTGAASLAERPRQSFFLTPLNPYSNNIHVFVNVEEVAAFTFLS